MVTCDPVICVEESGNIAITINSYIFEGSN